jgi:hypothetical protein
MLSDTNIKYTTEQLSVNLMLDLGEMFVIPSGFSQGGGLCSFQWLFARGDAPSLIYVAPSALELPYLLIFL